MRTNRERLLRAYDADGFGRGRQCVVCASEACAGGIRRSVPVVFCVNTPSSSRASLGFIHTLNGRCECGAEHRKSLQTVDLDEHEIGYLGDLLQRRGALTARDLRRTSRRYGTVDAARDALERGCAVGIASRIVDRHAGGRGRPATRYKLAVAVDRNTAGAGMG